MPPALTDACIKGDLVVFAGAGVSTETPMVFPYTFYADIASELDTDPAEDVPFPALMQRFVETHSRIALLERIKQRLDYVKSFPALDLAASRFHQELSSLFTVTDIFTTNWDDYFERECAATPFITESDWAFWRLSERKVFKLHGSIASPGSVIATEADYERCYTELGEGLVGAHLKTMLATKTLVFIGYSFRDSDFIALYELMKRRMKDLLPRAYVVTLDEREAPEIAKDMHIIRTDARYFIEKLKESYSEDEFVSDQRFELIPGVREIVRSIHHHMLDQGEMRENPEMFLCASYHDGLIHAFDHQMANKSGGKYSHRCHTEGLLRTYETIQESKLGVGRYEDVAYVEGYMNGLLFLIADDDERKLMPYYYVSGCSDTLRTYHEFQDAVSSAASLDPDAHSWAAKHAGRLAPGVVWQHQPFLL